MEIHNVIEDFVHETVRELFDDEERARRNGFCTCYSCRLDVACYVLNRMEPEYVVSGRGAARAGTDNPSFIQKKADLVVLINEGWRRINTQKRPGHEERSRRSGPLNLAGPVYNMPCIMGRVFDGGTFSPLVGAIVELFLNGAKVRMIDDSWQNPVTLVDQNGGTFVFYPFPEQTKDPGKRKSFRFELRCQKDGYETLSHFMEVDLVSELNVIDLLNMEHVQKIKDLYMFPPGGDED